MTAGRTIALLLGAALLIAVALAAVGLNRPRELTVNMQREIGLQNLGRAYVEHYLAEGRSPSSLERWRRLERFPNVRRAVADGRFVVVWDRIDPKGMSERQIAATVVAHEARPTQGEFYVVMGNGTVQDMEPAELAAKLPLAYRPVVTPPVVTPPAVTRESAAAAGG